MPDHAVKSCLPGQTFIVKSYVTLPTHLTPQTAFNILWLITMPMIVMMMLCVSLSCIYLSNAIPQRLWMIRHCDKPINDADSCCSDFGHQREQKWSIFLHKYLDQENSVIEMYASNFRTIQTCNYNINYEFMTSTPRKNCQRAQRMYSSAYYIKENLESLNYTIVKNINTNNCIGEESDVVHSINNSTQITDAILIWQHDEILQIIRSFGINANDFSKSDKYIYDVAFMLDISSNKLYYECFEYYDVSVSSCSPLIHSWLNSFSAGTIDSYRHRDHGNAMSFQTYLIIFTFSIVLLYFIYFLFISITTYNHRQTYTNVL